MEKLLDEYDFFVRNDRERAIWQAARPVCDCCGEPIQEETFHQIGGDNYCDSCLDGMVVITEDLLDE